MAIENFQMYQPSGSQDTIGKKCFAYTKNKNGHSHCILSMTYGAKVE
jgi:hypothetical protein